MAPSREASDTGRNWTDADAGLRPTERVGVLLLNLGGPETLADVQPFLYNLFADDSIIRLPPYGAFSKPPTLPRQAAGCMCHVLLHTRCSHLLYLPCNTSCFVCCNILNCDSSCHGSSSLKASCEPSLSRDWRLAQQCPWRVMSPDMHLLAQPASCRSRWPS